MNYYHRGGVWGHWLRRLIHFSLFIVPFIYYWLLQPLLAHHIISAPWFVIILTLLIWSVDLIRLQKGWVIWGQRHYETHTISALAWGSLGITLVLLFTPETKDLQPAAFAIPLIGSFAWVDPLLGEMRRYQWASYWMILTACALLSVIWFVAHYYLATPLWLVPIMIPTIVLSELIKLPGLDDNFTMLAIPLCVIIMLFS